MTITNNSTRNFGIELEIVFRSMGTLKQALTEAGITVSVENYNHETRSHWKLVPDGSVEGGFELVSPILNGQAGFEAIEKVSAVLVAQGVRINRSCGFHVHVDAQDLNGATLVNICKRYSALEASIDAFMPISRRANNNDYCRPMDQLLGQIQHVAGNAQVTPGTVARATNARYFKVNLQSYLRHGTVEFRQHSGTIEARKILPWVLFCLNFVETSKVETIAHTQGGSIPESFNSLRKNSIERKFAALATLLDQHITSDQYVSAAEIARAMGVEEVTVPVYISQFRTKYPEAAIANRRGRGYYRNSSTPLVSYLGIVTGNVTYTTRLVSEDQSLFAGLPQEAISYFQERTQDFATA